MEKNDISIGIVGSGGAGVMAAGTILVQSAAHEGLHCMMMKSFGPQIRGGESSCRLRLSENKVLSQGNGLDVLVCFNWNDYQKFISELPVEDNVVILMDENEEMETADIPIDGGKNRTVYRIPFEKIAKEINNPRGMNMVMLGVLSELFNLPKAGLKAALQNKFKGKKAELIASNLQALQAGEDYVKANIKEPKFKFKYTKKKPRLVITGNEAVAFGAVAAGCRFCSSYPITPATEIMEWLGRELPKFGGSVVQAEDEIAAICMVTGAAYGGVKAIAATSGPGLSLKLEAIGLGTMAELPYVVVDVQRGGPSTGVPTKTEQADLFQAVYGMHGDAPHAVMASTDVEDCFRATMEAFNVAETYQMPVILLSEQCLGHRTETVRELDFEAVKVINRQTPAQLSKGSYKRFADTQDGISPITWPGIKGGEYLCSGIEHDEWGAPSAKYEVHEKMSAKRNKKLQHLEANFNFTRRYGEKAPEIGVLSWGSNKGVVREAVEYCHSKGISVGAIVPQLIFPLQLHVFQEFFESVKSLVVVENSFGGQFLKYIRSRLNLPGRLFHLKSAGGRIFTVRDVIQEIEKAQG